MSQELFGSLEGKINNTDLPVNKALLPLYEAVVNSIQAIEERGLSPSEGKITITVLRNDEDNKNGQAKLPIKSTKSQSLISGFIIEDNGIGFDDINYKSFNTSDSTHKKNIGGKGLGHFSWLKAFEGVHIDSVYEKDGKHYRRKFDFSLSSSSALPDSVDSETLEEVGTRIHLDGFKSPYNEHDDAYRKLTTVSQKIFDHCISYFIYEIAPVIEVKEFDSIKNEEICISLNALYHKFKSTIQTETFPILKHEFTIYHTHLKKKEGSHHQLILCGDKRSVLEESISKKIGNSKQLFDGENRFYYNCYVFSQYLDKHVNPLRDGFTIPDKRETDCFNVRNLLGSDPSLNEIRDHILKEKILKHLSPYLVEGEKQKQNLINNIIKRHPNLRSVIKLFPNIIHEIDVGAQEDTVLKVLYKYKGLAEEQIVQNVKRLQTQAETCADIPKAIKETMEGINDIQRDNLAGYIVYRHHFLDLFERKLKYANPESETYHLESNVHDLIFPRYRTSNDLMYEDHNLWVLDDRLSFHEYAWSDKKFTEILDDESTERPDILIYLDKHRSGYIQSFVIVEFKRPAREDYAADENPIHQLLKYVEKVRSGKQKSTAGDPIIVTNDTICYCYAICDLTDNMRSFCKFANLRELPSKNRYYGYNYDYNCHVEVISYREIVGDAKMRNYPLFLKLGLEK